MHIFGYLFEISVSTLNYAFTAPQDLFLFFTSVLNAAAFMKKYNQQQVMGQICCML